MTSAVAFAEGLIAQRRLALWNRLVHKNAKALKVEPRGVSFIHPTKGRRFVSSRRLGYTEPEWLKGMVHV